MSDAEEKRLAASRGDAVDGGTGADRNSAPAVPLVHFQHLSAADSVRLVRRAKSEGLPITAEVTAAPPAAHRRTPDRLRPEPQGEPAHPLRGGS